jgi:ABC-type multidrug transport system permease subunit
MTQRTLQVQIFSGVALPLILVGVSSAFVGGVARTRLLVGCVLYAAMQQTLQRTAMNLTEHRIFGYRRLLATTALTRDGYLAGSALDAVVASIFPVAAALVGPWISGAAWPSSLTWLIPYTLACISMFTIGVIFATLPLGHYGVAVVSNTTTMLTLAFCPLLYPTSSVPPVLRPIVEFLPASLAADLMTASWLNAPVSASRMVLLVGWALTIGIWAYVRFPWNEESPNSYS